MPVVIRALDALGGVEQIDTAFYTLLGHDPVLTAQVLDHLDTASVEPPLHRLEDLLPRAGTPQIKSIVTRAALQLLSGRAPDTDPDWERALLCAYYSRGLASRIDYPDLHEAYLAGLLHNLDRFTDASDPVDAESPGFDREAVSFWTERWGGRSFLADAVRFQAERYERLRDASPLVRILGLARMLAEGQADAPRIAAVLLPELSAEGLDALHGEVRQHVRAQTAGLKLHHSGDGAPEGKVSGPELRTALHRYNLLENALSGLRDCTTTHDLIAAAARHLEQAAGLDNALFLRHHAANHTLASFAAAADAPALAIGLDGSHAAAARAFSIGQPVFLATGNPASVSLIDYQYARLNGHDGIVAIPVLGSKLAGVFLACAPRQALDAFATERPYLNRWSHLVSRSLDRVETAQTGSPLADGAAQAGEQARRIAHEINNPLGIIKNYLGLLGAETSAMAGGEESADSGDRLRIIRDEIDRIAQIVRGLAGPDETIPSRDERFDINALIEDLAQIAEPSFRADRQVQLRTRLDPRLHAIQCDRGKLKQLLLNLLLNAAEALEAAGTITVETHRVVNHRMEPFLEILVSDTGPGIPPEVAEHLFEPVQSTKGPEHTGIGLALVKSLAIELNMTVACRSDATGTTFQLMLPLLSEHEPLATTE